jgi:hypothetical protein
VKSHRTIARSVLLALLGLAAVVAVQTASAIRAPDEGLSGKRTTIPPRPAEPPPTTTTSAPKPKPKTKPRLIFPVVGPVQFTDDFGAPRTGHTHQGNDLMAPKRSIAVAVENGTVKFGNHPTAGCYLYLYGKNKTYYMYIHLNNDLTKGNDNRGKCIPGVSYAPGLKNGQKVKAGEPIGFVGDSGDANGVASHLHFEVHPRGGGAVSPYPYLTRAIRLLFAASRGSTFTLSLRGTVVKTADGQLQLKVTTLTAYPGAYRFVGVNRAVQLAVPISALLQRKVNGVTRSVTAPLTTLKRNLPVQIWTEAAPSTLDAQMGKDGILSAARILVLR